MVNVIKRIFQVGLELMTGDQANPIMGLDAGVVTGRTVSHKAKSSPRTEEEIIFHQLGATPEQIRKELEKNS